LLWPATIGLIVLTFAFRRPRSPEPYVAPERANVSLFPLEIGSGDATPLVPLQILGLEDYVREFNKGQAPILPPPPDPQEMGHLPQPPPIPKITLRIWKPSRSDSGYMPNPVVLRLTIPNVLVVFVTLLWTPEYPTLVVENITPFGPREAVSLSFPTWRPC
jgi:hypothetical protein